MSQSDEKHELGTLDTAIEACENNIKRHRLLASKAMSIGTVVILAVVFFSSYYAMVEGGIRDDVRIGLLNAVKEKQVALEYATIRDSKPLSLRRLEIQLKELDDTRPVDKAPDDKELLQWEESKDILQKSYDSELKINDERILKEIEKARAELNKVKEEYRSHAPAPLISQELMLGVVAMSVLVISVFTAFYRFHQREMTKNEHYKLGFLRIQIAASNNEREGFKDEVRTALTLNAFTIPSEGLFDRKDKKISSPIPGHPTSELATGMVNKLLEQVEVVLQPKGK